MIYRSECNCPCHAEGVAMLHIKPCCEPDPKLAYSFVLGDVVVRSNLPSITVTRSGRHVTVEPQEGLIYRVEGVVPGEG